MHQADYPAKDALDTVREHIAAASFAMGDYVNDPGARPGGISAQAVAGAIETVGFVLDDLAQEYR